MFGSRPENMNRSILFLSFIFLTQTIFGQASLKLIDSLARAESPLEKIEISMKIADSLASEDWKRALFYMDVAKKNAIKANSAQLMAKYYEKAGNIYSKKDALDIALEHYLKANTYYKTLPQSEKFKFENNLAILYAQTGNSVEAIHYFKRIYNYQKQKKDTTYLATILNNIGRIWLRKNADTSLFYLKKSQQLIKNQNLDKLKFSLFTNISKCYFLKGNLSLALQYLNLSKTQITPKTPPKNISWLYSGYSNYYKKTSQLDSAIYFAKKSVNILDSVAPYSFEQQRAVKNLYQLYQRNQDYKLASQYFGQFAEITDSINLADKRINVEKLLIKEEYRNRMKIKELEESKRQSRNYLILSTLLTLLLFLGILILKYKGKLKQIKLQQELETARQKELQFSLQLKNKELTGKAMLEIHRSEILVEILEDLKQVKRKAVKKETQHAIDYISKRLKRNLPTGMWEEFERSFELVHDSFYSNLMLKHPDLTPRDRRLAALLKLDLTSKEIAQITGQTAKAIENARTRLRKKMNITNSHTDISSYLSQF